MAANAMRNAIVASDEETSAQELASSFTFVFPPKTAETNIAMTGAWKRSIPRLQKSANFTAYVLCTKTQSCVRASMSETGLRRWISDALLTSRERCTCHCICACEFSYASIHDATDLWESPRSTASASRVFPTTTVGSKKLMASG